MIAQRTIAATTHGRYLVDVADGAGPLPLLVGFHGYGEQATVQFERLSAVRGHASWGVVSIQALHRFYSPGSNEQVVANWMTREDRDLNIADNVAYVDSVLDAVARESHEPKAIVYLGFSQGASMAYRAAALGGRRAVGVVSLGGDIPPELTSDLLSKIPAVLIGRGVRDRYYQPSRLEADRRRLEDAGVPVQVVELDAGHRWVEPFTDAVAAWLRQFE